MKTKSEIKRYVKSLDLPKQDINEAKYTAIIKAHEFCGMGIAMADTAVCAAAIEAVEDVARYV